MKIKYEFVTGTVEIEVSDEMAIISMELDRGEYNNNHKETRRHTTLDNGVDEKEWLACEEYDPLNIVEAEEEAKRIRNALKSLTTPQKILIEKIFLEGISTKEFAQMKGVSSAAISQQIRTIRKKLKKLL